MSWRVRLMVALAAMAAHGTTACGKTRCQTDADCPNAAPFCFLSECGGTEPPYFGERDQPCRFDDVCDAGLRCVEDDGDPDTRPVCRRECTLAAADAPCPASFACIELPSTPGSGACVPNNP